MLRIDIVSDFSRLPHTVNLREACFPTDRFFSVGTMCSYLLSFYTECEYALRDLHHLVCPDAETRVDELVNEYAGLLYTSFRVSSC